MGFDFKISLIAMPVDKSYANLRKASLREGLGGIVFVADSLVIHRKNNIQYLKESQKILTFFGKSIYQLPLILQYDTHNARHGVPLMTTDKME